MAKDVFVSVCASFCGREQRSETGKETKSHTAGGGREASTEKIGAVFAPGRICAPFIMEFSLEPPPRGLPKKWAAVVRLTPAMLACLEGGGAASFTLSPTENVRSLGLQRPIDGDSTLRPAAAPPGPCLGLFSLFAGGVFPSLFCRGRMRRCSIARVATRECAFYAERSLPASRAFPGGMRTETRRAPMSVIEPETLLSFHGSLALRTPFARLTSPHITCVCFPRSLSSHARRLTPATTTDAEDRRQLVRVHEHQ